MPGRLVRSLIAALAATTLMVVAVATAGCGEDSTPTTPGNVRRPLDQQIDSADITGQPYGSWADIERYAIHSVER